MKPVRAVGLVIHNGQVLVIRRRRNGEEFYVLPGGHVEVGETVVEAAVRELREETSIDAEPVRCLYELHHRTDAYGPQEQYVWLMRYRSGEPRLGPCPERRANETHGERLYEPIWLPIEQFCRSSLVYPRELQQQICIDLEKDFSFTAPRYLEAA